MKKYPGLLFSLFGIIIFTIEFFIGLPILLYFVFVGVKGLLIFEIMNSSGDNVILNWIGFLSPTTRIVVIILLGIFSLAITGIFAHKKRGYKMLFGLSCLMIFASMVFVVTKTYNYLPKFIMSVIAGTILVVGGFVSWYICFQKYKTSKVLSLRLPSLIWVGSFVLFFVILTFFPDPIMTVDYSISMGVEQAVVMAPRTLDIKEFLFAGGFLGLIWLFRFSSIAIGNFPLASEQKSRYQRKVIFCLILSGLLAGIIFLFLKRSDFTVPHYDLNQYDTLLVKSGYQENIPTGANIFYLQNTWLIAHTGLLNKIEAEDFVHLNYFSQGQFVLTGFTAFWTAYSGAFRAEFSGMNIIDSGYTMVNPHTAEFPFQEEKLREREHLATTVAIALCKQGQCREGFVYWNDRAIFTQNRLNAGQGLMGTLISLISMQDVLSGVQELVPYLSSEQKLLAKTILQPLDISKTYHNMMVQEYYFVYGLGVENIQRYLQEENVYIPKFIFDSEYTDAQMKNYFAEAILNKGKNPEKTYSEKLSLKYNFKGTSLLTSLLPRVSNIYDRLESLEQQTKMIVNTLSK